MNQPHSIPEDNAAANAADEVIESLVADATDDYMDRALKGEEPSIEEYARRYPQISGILRELLPAVRLMQQTEAAPGDPLGCLGDFRLVRQIGRGGMGVVYEAEQISLRRRVALKVLPLAAALDPRQLERFRLEAQAAAHLHHTNIVPIYSVGCERGVYYYAMQYIEGRSLADVIAQMAPAFAKVDQSGETTPPAASAVPLTFDSIHHAPRDDSPHAEREGYFPGLRRTRGSAPVPATPSMPDHGVAGQGVVACRAPAIGDPAAGAAAGLPSPSAAIGSDTVSDLRAGQQTLWSAGSENHFQRVAALGAQAAEALEHAHSMGVIHRDIKPANLLLDMRGTLYVADFGLARLQGASGLTQTGGMAGTLRYMSPEQVMGQRGQVDHRTDIYSLGITLYELLALAPAFEASERPALLQQIVQDEPVSLRQRNKAIPVDLETIVLKAMAKDPVSRYANAQQMADDLRRYLEHRPILARRPTLWETAAKWTRRHRGVAAAALVVITLAAIGFAVSTALVVREQWRTQAAYESLAREQAKTQAAYEAEAQQRTRAEENARQAREVVDFITEVSEEELADKPELWGVRRMLLAAALDYYREFIDHSQSDPSLTAQLVASHVRVAAILDEIGSKADALAALQRARDLQEKQLRKDPMMPELQRGFFSIYSRLDLLRGGRDLNLLQQRAVQEDLKLSKEQMEQIEAISETRRANLADPRRLTAEEWRGRFEQLDQQQRDVNEVLLPHQTSRLAQIALQQRGTEAFTDSEVAKSLGLNPKQLQEIRLLREEARKSLWAAGRPGEMRADQWKKARDLSRKTNDQVLAALTPEQQTQWQKMIGEPFRGKLTPHRGGGRPWPGRERMPPDHALPDHAPPPPIPADETVIDPPGPTGEAAPKPDKSK
ncbi:MAG: protein kinase [Planctomycetes bacterium]|nr:protein kinase [Planctomycetota bacterium]